jgi:hypothetical protein
MDTHESLTKQILLFGHDAMLLSTRQWLMEEYGNVQRTGDIRDLRTLAESHSFDLVVVCHTATPEECQQLLDVIQRQSPEASFLSLVPVSHALNPVFRDGSVSNNKKFELVDGDPRALVHKVREILTSAQSKYNS